MSLLKLIINKAIIVFIKFIDSFLKYIEHSNWYKKFFGFYYFKDRMIIEQKIYSQNGEDGIIQSLFNMIGVRSKFYVEFGVRDGIECNTRYLREKMNFDGIAWDGGHEIHDFKLFKEFITAENINDLFYKYKIPYDFDLLSIDIDYNDLWVWKSLDEKYKPSIVVIEYNCGFPPPLSLTVPYDSSAQWDGQTNFMGASLSALNKLALDKKYTLVYCDNRGINAFFVHNDLLNNINFKIEPVKKIYKKGRYGIGPFGGHRQHSSDKKMIEY
jgi:hypothetical protein